MLGALLSVGGMIASNAMANNQSAKKQAEAEKEREKQAAQARVSYWDQLGRSKALLQNGLNQAADTTAQQLEYINSADAIMGGNGAKAAEMRNQVLQQKTAAERNALSSALTAEQAAAQQRDVVLNDVSKQKIADLENQRDNIMTASGNLNTALMGLAASDLASHLQSGKGVLESALSGNKAPGINITATDRSNFRKSMNNIKAGNVAVQSYVNNAVKSKFPFVLK